MAQRSLIEVQGASRLVRTMRKAGVDAKDLRDINKRAAALVVPSAQSQAPSRSGRLRRSIRAGATQKAGVVRAGRSSVPYAGPIHWGWPKHNIKPHPYLTDAAKATEPAWVGLYEREMRKLLETIQGA